MKYAALALALLAPALFAAPAAAKTSDTLIVISIDGFRADYFDRGVSPTLAALAADGVHAKAMHPSFPSVTQPNHYTLMTGLRPDHHGIVDNGFLDPKIPGLQFGEGSDANKDPRWWTTAKPLWLTAAKAGMKTAESHWPNGDVIVQGVDFTYHDASGHGATANAQTDAVLGWTDLAADKRPSLILLHYSAVDTMGHVYGPDAPQVNAAISTVDAAIARLVDGLKSRGTYDHTNIVIVSDHGMTAISNDRGYTLDNLFNIDDATVSIVGADAGIWPKAGHEAEIEKALIDTPHPHITCWRKKDIPANLHYGTNSRVPPVFCLGEPGWSIVTAAALKLYPGGLKGNHGYDPMVPEMSAFFLAHGPAFAHGVTLEPFDNVDVYPVLAKVLGVKAQKNDGNAADLATAMK